MSAATETVLAMVDNLRRRGLSRNEMRESADAMLVLKAGNVQGERLAAVTAAAYLILVAEDADRELGA